MKFNGEVIKFNAYDSLKYPSDETHIDGINVLNTSSQNTFKLGVDDKLNVAIYRGHGYEKPKVVRSANCC